MERVTKSLKIDPAVWKEVKRYCVDNDISISEYFEKLAKKDLKKK